MTAEAIITEIEKLPPEEKTKVAAFVGTIVEKPREKTIRYADKESFDKVKADVFKYHSELLAKLAE